MVVGLLDRTLGGEMMSRRRTDGRVGPAAAGLLSSVLTTISTEPMEAGYEFTGELGR